MLAIITIRLCKDNGSYSKINTNKVIPIFEYFFVYYTNSQDDQNLSVIYFVPLITYDVFIVTVAGD